MCELHKLLFATDFIFCNNPKSNEKWKQSDFTSGLAYIKKVIPAALYAEPLLGY